MYGVPSDLDLNSFQGAELVQIAIGAWQIQLRFYPECSISVESTWEIRDQAGVILDRHEREFAASQPYLPILLHHKVVATRVSAPDWIELEFANGQSLRIHDDSHEFESFTIWPLGSDCVVV